VKSFRKQAHIQAGLNLFDRSFIHHFRAGAKFYSGIEHKSVKISRESSASGLHIGDLIMNNLIRSGGEERSQRDQFHLNEGGHLFC